MFESLVSVNTMLLILAAAVVTILSANLIASLLNLMFALLLKIKGL